jgi:CheY-like chemotaxis protein
MDAPLKQSLQRGAEGRFSGFEQLMPFRVQEILLVASLYDSYTLEEGGRLTELLLSEYRELNLSFAPHVTRAASGEAALAALTQRRYDLVIAMSRLGDMDVTSLSRAIKKQRPELPVVALAVSPRELSYLVEQQEAAGFDRVYYWLGDVRLLLALVKLTEDLRNVDHDTTMVGVRVILLVEDSIRFYSAYLPLLYTEILRQTHALMEEGLNLSHKLLRMRARPKILLACSFEEAWRHFSAHQHHMLGVISDARFPWDGQKRDGAGLEFIRRVKQTDPHMPAVIQSSDPAIAAKAASIGAGFIHKESSHLLQDLRTFMLDNFGFGDFVFRMPDGSEVGRASDLRTLVEALERVPDESLRFHANQDHFSNWLRARTEFALASQLRPRKASDFSSVDEIRRYLIESIDRFRQETQRGIVADFSRRHFDASADFTRIGGGSLGGKARGLAFMNSLLTRFGITAQVPGVKIRVPPTAVVGTDVFDTFLDQDDLRARVLEEIPDDEVVAAFLAAKLPAMIYGDLETFLRQVQYPLAVRSSSLLEDSQYQPFAGVYSTYMLPNNHPILKTRLDQLCDAIKLVYASTYFRGAKAYLEATGNRVEEERMAVIIQQVIGRHHEHYTYPDFAGVALSTNYYPTGGMAPEDGVAFVALGLGRTVVEGRKCLRFSPRRPGNLPQFSTIKEMLDNSQREFYAVDRSQPDIYPRAQEDFDLALLQLADAERHGTLEPVGSVYSAENNAVYDGIWRPGVRLVTFAHVLKHDLFPLPAVLQLLLDLGEESMNCPVEIEFAVNLARSREEPHEVGYLQIRPLAGAAAVRELAAETWEESQALCTTDMALGNGRIGEIRDILYVVPDRFDRGSTREIAEQIGELNRRLREEARPYLLIGPGRWGSADRWLGIPVRWAQISGARVIVETALEDIKVEPSQGTHFFQNLTSFQVGYLTVHPGESSARLDWDWLESRPALAETDHLRLLRLERPLTVLIEGQQSKAVILKPEGGPEHPGAEGDTAWVGR